jgi:hypothetical protein
MWQVNGPRPCSAGRLAQQEYALHPINGASCRRGLLRAVIAASITGIVILTGLLLMPLIKGRDGCQFAKTARRYLTIGEPTVRPAAADEATASPAPDLAEFGTKCVRIVHRTNEPEPIVPNGFGVNLFAPRPARLRIVRAPRLSRQCFRRHCARNGSKRTSDRIVRVFVKDAYQPALTRILPQALRSAMPAHHLDRPNSASTATQRHFITCIANFVTQSDMISAAGPDAGAAGTPDGARR